jgi:hypothetical protein
MICKFFVKVTAFADVKWLARLCEIKPGSSEEIIALNNPIWDCGDRVNIEVVPLARCALPPVHGYRRLGGGEGYGVKMLEAPYFLPGNLA